MRAVRLSEQDLSEACNPGPRARIGRRVDPSSDPIVQRASEVVALPAPNVVSEVDVLARVTLLETPDQLKGEPKVSVSAPKVASDHRQPICNPYLASVVDCYVHVRACIEALSVRGRECQYRLALVLRASVDSDTSGVQSCRGDHEVFVTYALCAIPSVLAVWTK